jgi:hypothetical protein
MLNIIPYISLPNYNILVCSVLFLNRVKTIVIIKLLEADFPSSIDSQQHCSVKSGFGYFADGCFIDRPSLVHFPATGGRQFNKQHQAQNAEYGAVDVAVDVMQKS